MEVVWNMVRSVSVALQQNNDVTITQHEEKVRFGGGGRSMSCGLYYGNPLFK